MTSKAAHETGSNKVSQENPQRKPDQKNELEQEPLRGTQFSLLASGEPPPPQKPAPIRVLQRLIGNRKVANMLTSRMHSIQREQHSTRLRTRPGGSIDRPVMGATTTRRADIEQLRPLSEQDRNTLEEVIPGTPLFDLINQRDERLRELRGRQRDLSQSMPPGGLPEAGTAESEAVETLEPEVESLQTEITRLNTIIQAGLAELGISREEELVNLVSEQFPALFERRAREIAHNELEHNRAIVETEAERYGLAAGPGETESAQNRTALRGAAQELVNRDQRIAEMRAEATAHRQEAGQGRPTVTGTTRESVARMAEVTTQQQQRQQLFQAYAARFPILHRVQPQAIANADDRQLSTLIGGQVNTLLDNIGQTQDNIRSGELQVWDLPSVVERTKADLGIGHNRVLLTAINSHIQQTRSNAAIRQMGIAALGITASIVAGIATGGLALVAGGVALGTSVYQLTESVQSYMSETAASNTAMDPRVADLSRREPELQWVILDLVGVILDGAEVVRIFGSLRSAARAVIESGDLEAFARTARSVIPMAADNLIASASHQAAVSSAMVHTIEAVGDAFRHADMELLIGEIEAFAEQGFARVVGELHAMQRIHPLTEEGIQSALGFDRAEDLIVNYHVLGHGGFYDDVSGHLFIRPGGSVEELAVVVVHETTHYVQDLYGWELRGFKAEFQAIMAMRDYMVNLERAAGQEALNAIPDFYRDFINMTNEDIAAWILNNPTYQSLGYINPADIDYDAVVREVLETVRTFEG